MHARRAIMNAAATALNPLSITGSRVHPGRTRPIAANGEPYLLVYARQEQAAGATMKGAGRKLLRRLNLVVEGVDTGATDTDELLDQIAEQVEAALAADSTLGGTCKDLELAQTEIVPTTDDAERRIVVIRLTFAVVYMTVDTDPATAV